jgi:hypothetical protein
MMFRTALGALLSAAFLAPPAYARTHVFPPGDSLPTEIATRLVSGDTLLVSPGARRAGNVVVPCGITIRGQSTIDAVIFTPGKPQSPIFIVLAGTDTTRVENMTFDCKSDQLATALYFHSAVMSVRGNRFTGGFAIYADSSSGLVTENTFEGVNSALRCNQSSMWVDRNDIIGANSAISLRGSPLRITRNRIVQNINTGIVVSGKRFAPVIGGEPGMGNEIHGGYNSDVFTTGGKSINAQYNYWGIRATEEMNTHGYPANITSILDGWDQDKAAGKVDYRNWLDRPGGQPVKMKKRAAAGVGAGRTTVALAALGALVALGVFLGARRRRASGSA